LGLGPRRQSCASRFSGVGKTPLTKAQAHMAARGFADRQLRILGKSRADKVAHHYKVVLKANRQGKLVGDLPELLRALDSHGFADLNAAVAFGCSLALADTSPAGAKLRREWNMGTKDVLWACMEKMWMEVAPTNERVVEDVDRMLVVLDKIIAAGGCVVLDEFLRTGRRAVRADGKGMLKNKPRKRQKIATQEARPHDPDLNAAYALLVKLDHAGNHTFA